MLSDIQALLDSTDTHSFEYQEIIADTDAAAALQRWPLLDAIHQAVRDTRSSLPKSPEHATTHFGPSPEEHMA